MQNFGLNFARIAQEKKLRMAGLPEELVSIVSKYKQVMLRRPSVTDVV